MIKSLILFATLLSSAQAWSHGDSGYNEDYFSGRPRPTNEILYSVPSKLRWLYESLVSAVDRSQQVKFAERTFAVHLEDSFKGYPHPDEIKFANARKGEFQVKGRMTYAGFVSKVYTYDVLPILSSSNPKGIIEQKGVKLSVRVHLNTKREEDWVHFSRLMKLAENRWNSAANRHRNQMGWDFPVRFQFELVRVKGNAHFSVKVLDNTRGPYDTNWSRSWGDLTVAHELGHMLGLGDEYNLITSKSDCLRHYFMCTSSGEIQPMHLYFVARRLLEARR